MKERFKWKDFEKVENLLSDGFKGRQSVAREDPITLVTDSVTILWEHGSIERWRSCNLDAPREALLHSDSNSTCICKGNQEDQPTNKNIACRGIIACPKICRPKLISTKDVITTAAKCGTTCIGVDENRIALCSQTLVICWPKSYFRTEVPKFKEF